MAMPKKKTNYIKYLMKIIRLNCLKIVKINVKHKKTMIKSDLDMNLFDDDWLITYFNVNLYKRIW